MRSRLAPVVAVLLWCGCTSPRTPDAQPQPEEVPQAEAPGVEPQARLPTMKDAVRDGHDPNRPIRVETHAFYPDGQPLSANRLAQLQMDEGFGVEVFARDLEHARMIAVGPTAMSGAVESKRTAVLVRSRSLPAICPTAANIPTARSPSGLTACSICRLGVLATPVPSLTRRTRP